MPSKSIIFGCLSGTKIASSCRIDLKTMSKEYKLVRGELRKDKKNFFKQKSTVLTHKKCYLIENHYKNYFPSKIND